MKIGIITAKCKLSKSVVNQMRHAPLNVLKHGKHLGFVIDVVKKCYKAILIQHEDDHYFIPANYTKGDISVYRRVGRFSSSMKFDSEDDCNEWWAAYEAVREKAVDHIYI